MDFLIAGGQVVEWSSSFSLGPGSPKFESSLIRNFFLPFFYNQVNKFVAEEAPVKDIGPSQNILCEKVNKKIDLKGLNTIQSLATIRVAVRTSLTQFTFHWM